MTPIAVHLLVALRMCMCLTILVPGSTLSFLCDLRQAVGDSDIIHRYAYRV
jgi:hypothetical protein